MRPLHYPSSSSVTESIASIQYSSGKGHKRVSQELLNCTKLINFCGANLAYHLLHMLVITLAMDPGLVGPLKLPK